MFSKFLYKLRVGSTGASAICVNHLCPYSVSAGRDCCWRRAPVTGVNTGETTLSEMEAVQVLILIFQHGLPAPIAVLPPEMQVKWRCFDQLILDWLSYSILAL